MPFCTNCGNELRPGVRFCELCGQAQDQVQTGGAPPGVTQPGVTLPGVTPPAMAVAKPPKTWVKPLAIVGSGAAILVIVALVLVFTVFSGGGAPGLAQFQLKEGAKLEYYLPSLEDYAESKPIDVEFNLEGPWDFSKGPDELVATDTVMKADEVEAAEDFPDATAVIVREYGDVTESDFLSQDQKGTYGYGIIYDYSAVEGGQVYHLTNSETETRLEFPVEVGKSWDSEYESLQGGETVSTETRDRKVISKNSITVPAGKFDECYMVRSDATYEDESGKGTFIAYAFYVPNVGMVANVTSLDGEKDEAFDTARDLLRLKKVVSKGTTPIE